MGENEVYTVQTIGMKVPARSMVMQWIKIGNGRETSKDPHGN